MSELIKTVPEARSFFAAGAFAITYLASRGEEHSKLHKYIANAALVTETITFVSGFGRGKFSKEVGSVGLAITIACFAVVAVTDEPVIRYFQSGGLTKKDNIVNLGKELFAATKRHLMLKLNVIIL